MYQQIVSLYGLADFLELYAIFLCIGMGVWFAWECVYEYKQYRQNKRHVESLDWHR
jgi:hypothetical protein